MSSTTANAIDHVTANTPEEFVDSLYPRHALWLATPGDWVFRGQGDSRWALVPAAFREDCPLYSTAAQRVRRGRAKTIHTQIDAEFRTLRLFLLRADSAGLPLAKQDDSLFDRGVYFDQWAPLLNRIKSGNVQEWPPPEIRPNLALAQHYGIPTRLLDWTAGPLIAA